MKDIYKKMYKESFATFNNLLFNNLKDNKKQFIITANPETIVMADKNKDFYNILLDDKVTIVADGISLVKTAKILDYDIKERITGVDITTKLLEYGNQLEKNIYLFGAKEEVLNKLKEEINKNYSNIKIVGSTNGYVNDKEKTFNEIINLKPDIVLVALGIPIQEELIYKYYDNFNKGIFIGVGGTFDVLSGFKKRAPKIFIKLNLEWLYRLITEPKRFKRFYNNNIKFMFLVKKEKRKIKND